jgi:hypothetical protein
MLIIKELIELLGDDFLPLPDNKISKLSRKLFVLIKENVLDDAEAAVRMKMKPGSVAFRKVKHYLKVALMNGVTRIEPPSLRGDVSNRSDIAGQVLNFFVASSEASGFSRGVLAKEWNAEVLQVVDANNFDEHEAHARLLKFEMTDPGDWEEEDKENYFRETIVRAQVDFHMQIARGHVLHSGVLEELLVSTEEHEVYLKEALIEIDQLSKGIPVSQGGMYSLSGLKYRYAVVSRDYRQAVEVSALAVAYFSQAETFNEIIRRIFYNYNIEAHLYLNDGAEALRVAEEVISMEYNSLLNKYITHELGMIAALRCGAYQKAYDIHSKLDLTVFYNKINTFNHDTMRIIEAYLYLLIRIGIVKKKNDDERFGKFRFFRFMNDLGLSVTEKSRRNVHVKIIQLMELSFREEYPDIQFSDAIRKYVQRHLKKESAIRAKLFLLALMQVPENGFSKKYAVEAGRKYIDELTNYPLGEHDQYLYLEFIPFEKLWQMVLERL